MGRNILRTSGMLIGLYLLVAYSTGSGKLVANLSSGATNLVKAFQGRS
jgi:hypothetical protein